MVRKMPAIGRITDSDTSWTISKTRGENSGRGQTDLFADFSDLFVDTVKHPGQVAHNPADQYLLKPLCDFLEYLVHGSASLAQQREAGQQGHERCQELKESCSNRKDFHVIFLLK